MNNSLVPLEGSTAAEVGALVPQVLEAGRFFGSGTDA
jgi:hypothetical protein